MEREIIFIRHTSVEVPRGTCYGQTDVPLRATFVEEAEEVRRNLALRGPIDVAYTSPLSRCVRLADYCGYTGAVADRRLLELDFGAWEMKRYDEIQDPRLQAWYADYLHVAATDGESFMQQLHRVSAFLEELCSHRFRRVAVFTHGGVVACAQVWAGRASLEQAFDFVPPTGGIVTIPGPVLP